MDFETIAASVAINLFDTQPPATHALLRTETTHRGNLPYAFLLWSGPFGRYGETLYFLNYEPIKRGQTDEQLIVKLGRDAFCMTHTREDFQDSIVRYFEVLEVVALTSSAYVNIPDADEPKHFPVSMY